MIYSFHMPAFAFVSGYFARFNPEKILKKLLYPYCVYQILYLLFQRYCLGQENSIQFTTPYWLLWYMLAMVLWSVCLPVLSWKGFSPKQVCIATLIVSLAVGFDKTVGYYMSLSRAIVLLPFFMAGYFRLFDKVASDLNKQRKYSCLCTGILLMAAWLAWRYRGMIQSSWLYHSVSYEGGGYTVWIRAWLLFVAYVWIGFFFLVIPEYRLPVLSRVGQYTLPIFLLHGFFVRWVIKIQLFSGNECENILLAAVLAVVFCVLVGNSKVARGLRWTFEWRI